MNIAKLFHPTRRQIMKRAHSIARRWVGDYAARMSSGLRQAWREARTPGFWWVWV